MVFHKSVGRANVKWIVPDTDVMVLNRRIAECFCPVINVVDNDPPPRQHIRSASLRSRKRGHQKSLIVRDLPVRASTRILQPCQICVSRRLPKRWVLDGVIDLEQEGRHIIVKATEGPCCLPRRLVALCDLSDVACNLRVAAQVVNELGVRGAEEPLADRTK